MDIIYLTDIIFNLKLSSNLIWCSPIISVVLYYSSKVCRRSLKCWKLRAGGGRREVQPQCAAAPDGCSQACTTSHSLSVLTLSNVTPSPEPTHHHISY